MRQFYLAVVMPKLLDAADIFLIPESSQSKGMKGYITMLSRVQWQAALSITGAL